MDSPLPSSPICDQPDTFSPVEDFEEKMLEAGDAVLCPHTLRVVRSQSFTGKATDGAQRVVRSRSFTAKILCEEASDGAEDLDNVIWTGDDAEVNISPYHPLHKGAPLPADEEERNEVLLAEGVMDTGKEGELDAWAAITLKVFQAEHAWVSFVDSDRVWTKAEKGCGNLDLPRELDRAISFDAHTILSDEVLVVLDTRKDMRFMYNHLVGRHQVRFYAGAPICLKRNGKVYRVGALSIMDLHPRENFGDRSSSILKTLAAAVETRLEIRTRHPAAGPLASRWVDGGVEARMTALRQSFVFSARRVDDACLRMFAERLRPRVFQPNAFVTKIGMAEHSMYFIAAGSCACLAGGEVLETLSVGQCFGEVTIINLCKMKEQGLLDSEAGAKFLRTADIQALERCELLELRFVDAWPLIHKAPNLWYTLETLANQRLARAITMMPSIKNRSISKPSTPTTTPSATPSA